MSDYKIPQSFCPQCNYCMDMADKVHGEDGGPDPGSCSICLSCGQILIFDDQLALRKATAQEIKELINDPPTWDLINAAIREIKKRGPIRGDRRA